MRLPFLDSQTGVAQNNCYIWMEKTHRGPGGGTLTGGCSLLPHLHVLGAVQRADASPKSLGKEVGSRNRPVAGRQRIHQSGPGEGELP